MKLLFAGLSFACALAIPAIAAADEPAEQGRNDEPAAKADTKPEASMPTASASASQKDAPSDSCDCHCWHASHCGCKDSHSLSLSIAGVRPSLTHVSTTGGSANSAIARATTNDLGLGFAGQADSYALDGATRASMHWVLGGGQAGFEGMLAGVVDIGYRIDVTEHQGPFGRAGFDGRIQGNDALYFSSLELPRLTLGWQYLAGKTEIEIGARGGPILTGRFNPGEHGERRTTGALEYGGFMSAQVEFLRFEATAMRIDARNTGDHSPVDVGRAAVCGVAGKVGICADFSVFAGSAYFGPADGNADVVATYSGLTVGVASW